MFSFLHDIFVVKPCGLSNTLSNICGHRDKFIEAMDTKYSRPAAFILVLVYPVIFLVLDKFFSNFEWQEKLIIIRIGFSMGLIFLVYVWYTRRKISREVGNLSRFLDVSKDQLLKMDKDTIKKLADQNILISVILTRAALQTERLQESEYVVLRHEALYRKKNMSWSMTNFWGIDIESTLRWRKDFLESKVTYVVCNIRSLGFDLTYFNTRTMVKDAIVPYVNWNE